MANIRFNPPAWYDNPAGFFAGGQKRAGKDRVFLSLKIYGIMSIDTSRRKADGREAKEKV